MSPSRLQKFKQVLVFNKCTLVQRIRDAIASEKLGSQTIETDTTFSPIESPANGHDNPRVDDIYSFIEIKVKEVCRLEIEASTSYSNETIASLWEENNLLNIRLQELESRNESLREEGSFQNEALENEDRSRKHPKLENGAPKSRKRSTQKSKTKHPKLETCLSFKNTRQSLVKSPAAGIKHDNK